MRIAYVRVSTEEQNEARQREALESYNIEKWYCEKRSAKDTNRPQLEAMLAFARSGDVILSIFMIFPVWQGIRRIC